jgi:uncharacterized protein (UPF0332 family)
MVQPEDLVALAERLTQVDSEVERRAAVNRAYYAAHHAVLAVVKALPAVDKPLIPGRIGHREAQRRLEKWQHPNKELESLRQVAKANSLVLQQMIVAREEADYRIDENHDHRQAAMQLARGKRLLRFVADVASRLNPK